MSTIAYVWRFKVPKLYEKLLTPINLDKFTASCWCCRDFYSNSSFKRTHLNRTLNTVGYNTKFYQYSGKKTEFTTHKNYVNKELRAYIEKNKNRLKTTEERIKRKGNILIQDIRETKDKVKERVENIIEKENIYTIPNFLCLSRIVLSPYLGILIMQSEFGFALGILGFAAVTDLLDGWIARKWDGQSSKLGSILDPMADKVLVATLFFSLTYADLIPILLTSIIIAKDLILVLSGLIIRYKSLPPPKTLSRYFDVTHATVQVEPNLISKINTGLQLTLVGSTLAAPVFNFVGHPGLEYLWYLTGATTIASGLSYLFSKNAYRYLRKKK